jgi:phospholipase D
MIAKLWLISCLLMMPSLGLAESFTNRATYEVCFTPGQDCVREIIKEIKSAKKQILAQAYSFTDFDIAKALVQMKRKGVDVRMILDKSQLKTNRNLLNYLHRNQITLKIDIEPVIAHSKIILIDDATVIGGSYNYSKSAANKNAENITIIRDAKFFQKFIKNWYTRNKISIGYSKIQSVIMKNKAKTVNKKIAPNTPTKISVKNI